MTSDRLRVAREVTVWMLGFIAIVFIGGSLTMDLSGQSAADVFVIQRWSFEGLRIYLWLEALVLSAIVAALGAHGAALIALSITTLVLFNSCRYMRIV